MGSVFLRERRRGPQLHGEGHCLAPGTITPGQWQTYHANVNQSILSVRIDGSFVLKANVTFFFDPKRSGELRDIVKKCQKYVKSTDTAGVIAVSFFFDF